MNRKQARPQIDELLRRAINEKKLIQFTYQGKRRVAEPHDYGIQNGAVRLLSYQIGGASHSGRLPDWRWIEVPGISDLEILGKTFAGNRPVPSGKHHAWDQVFARVSGRN